MGAPWAAKHDKFRTDDAQSTESFVGRFRFRIEADHPNPQRLEKLLAGDQVALRIATMLDDLHVSTTRNAAPASAIASAVGCSGSSDLSRLAQHDCATGIFARRHPAPTNIRTKPRHRPGQQPLPQANIEQARKPQPKAAFCPL